MQIERSNVPGYDATVIRLDESERFVLGNPENPDDRVFVESLVAFDAPEHDPSGMPLPDDQRTPYFVVQGIEPVGQQWREVDHQFIDPGVLPPHVREHVGEALDHAPGAARQPTVNELARYRAARATADRSNERRSVTRIVTGNPTGVRAADREAHLQRQAELRKQPLDEATLTRLRNEHGVTNLGPRAQLQSPQNRARTAESTLRGPAATPAAPIPRIGR